MQTLLSLGTLAVGMLFVIMMIMITQKNKYFILDLVFLSFIIMTYEWIANTTIRVSMPFMNLNTIDFLCVYLLIVVATTKTQRFPSGIRTTWYVMLSFFMIGVIRGLFSNNFQLVVEDVRRLIWNFILPVGCFSILPFTFNDKKVQKKFKFYIEIIILFCIICWALDFAGIEIVRAQSDAGTTMRVLRAEQVQALGLIAIWMSYSDINSYKGKLRKLTIALLLVIVLLQHRSVWLSVAIGFVYLFLLGKFQNTNAAKVFRSKKFLSQFGAAVIVVIIALFALRNSTLMEQLVRGLQGIQGGEGTTLAYRQQLWVGHLSGLTPFEWFIGKPFGSGYFVQLANYTRDLTPHSAFVQTIIRTGLCGLVSMIIFYFSCIRKARINKLGYIEAGCIMMGVFYFAYTYHFIASVIIGIFIATLRTQSYSTESQGR